jgi:hypothetical protein
MENLAAHRSFEKKRKMSWMLCCTEFFVVGSDKASEELQGGYGVASVSASS